MWHGKRANVRIEVLGPIRLRDETASAVDVPERKVRALLAALAAAGGETVPADALIDCVWGERLPGNPARVLQAKLSQLRSLLDTAAPGARHLLARSPGGYSLAVTAENCDAVEFREAVRTASGFPVGQERATLLESALKLWRGAPYAELTDELWLVTEVAGLQEARLQAVELCAEALIAAGDAEQAVSLAAPHFAEHPTREGLAAPLLLGNYRSRRQPEALAVYERLRSHLTEEFGVDPGPELQELHLSILRQDPELEPSAELGGSRQEAVEEAVPVEPAPGSRLPSYASAFLGRAEEVQQIRGLLAEHRLVTLLGIGGIGKTRLAVQTAQGIAQARRGEAWFVDLTGAQERAESDGADLSERVVWLTAAALGLSAPWQGSLDLSDRIAVALHGRESLLVLDNCEHVIDEAAAFADDLLRRVPGVRILATSREPMSLPDEHRYMVPQLPVDGGSSPAVEFFLARAEAVNGGIEVEPATVEAVAELCRRLDGLPLALELAAARTSVLSVPELLVRITDRLDLLARPHRAAPRRQQTLRGMLDWSWSLLQEEERVLLRRLAVHPVTWRLDVIEQVCADPEHPGALGGSGCPVVESSVSESSGGALPRRRVLPVLASLVERSLVSTVSTGGELRYRLLETVGAYAVEKLGESGERETVADRHLSYHRNLVDCAREYLFGPHARDWVRRLDDARPHLSRAVQEALRRQDGASAVFLVLSTFWYRWMTGRVDSLVEELAAAAACPNSGDTPAERNAHAQVVVLAKTLEKRSPRDQAEHVLAALEGFSADEAGRSARMQVQWFAATVLINEAEHWEQGRRLADEAIDHLLATGDARGAAFASTQRDWFLLDLWDVPPRGLPEGHDAEQILRDHGDDYGLTQVLGVQHLWAETGGRRDQARALTDQTAELSASLGLDGETAYWRTMQAVNSLRQGDLEAAERHLQAGRELARHVAFVFCMVLAEAVEALLAARRGQEERAAELLAALSDEDRGAVHRLLVRFFAEAELPAGLQLSRA